MTATQDRAAMGSRLKPVIYPYLEKEGHKVVAPDLPGHGKDKKPINFYRYSIRLFEYHMILSMYQHLCGKLSLRA